MIDLAAYALLVLTVAAAGLYDLRTGKVPNALTYPAILTGFVFWGAVSLLTERAGFVPSVGAMLAGFVPFVVIYFLGGLGGGDVKLMAGVGALSASWRVVLGATVYAMVIALVIGVVVMIRNRATRRTLRNLIRMRRKRDKDAEPGEASPQIPFAVAVAVGVIIAGAEVMLDLPTPWSAFGP